MITSNNDSILGINCDSHVQTIVVHAYSYNVRYYVHDIVFRRRGSAVKYNIVCCRSCCFCCCLLYITDLFGYGYWILGSW